MPDAARDARIWLVHVQEMSNDELPSMVESADYHLRCLLAECERLERANEHWQTLHEIEAELMPHDIGILAHDKLGELKQLEAQKLALVAYLVKVHKHGCPNTVSPEWQALGAELQEAIDDA